MPEPKNSDVAIKAGHLLKRLIEASKDRLSESRDRGELAMKYYKAANYDHIYQTMRDELFFKACDKKVWEAFTILIGYLTPDKPHREIRQFMFADEQPGSLEDLRGKAAGLRLDVVQRYLNWSTRETGYQKHVRRVILDWLARGRGVLWTGIHPRKDVITSEWDSELNFSQDPNALVPEDVMWKGRTRCMARSTAYRRYPNAEAIIRDTTKAGKRFDYDPDSMSTTDSSKPNVFDNSLDLIKIHEVYMLNSITEYHDGAGVRDALRAAGVSEDSLEAQMVTPTPMRYAFTDDGVLLDVSRWEVPLYQDGLWPCTELVGFDDNSSLTPISPLDAALKFVEVINWMTTLIVGRSRMTMRMLMAIVNQNGDGFSNSDKRRISIGKDMEALMLNAVGERQHINEFIQEFKWDHNWVNSAMTLHEFFQRKFDDLSGISQIMRSGEPGTQDRSAEATRLRRETSFNRADDMRQSVLEMHDEVARKESIYLQFLKDAKYIGGIFGKSAAYNYGYLGSKADQDPMAWQQRLIEQGATPEVANAEAMSKAMRAYTVEDILHEASYETTVGEGPRHDRTAKIDALADGMNQTVPTLLQTGDPQDLATAYMWQAAYGEEVGLPDDLVSRLRERAKILSEMAPPPPPGAPDEGTDQVPAPV